MPRPEVMSHILAGENLVLNTCRQIVSETWQHCLVTNDITESCCVSNKTREIGYAHPLYIYPTANRDDLFAQLEPTERQPNLNPNLIAALENAHGSAPSPEAIFHYIYAILHAPTYREKYAEFLRSDFPRVPFTADKSLFTKNRIARQTIIRPPSPHIFRTRSACLPLRGRRRRNGRTDKSTGLPLRLR